MLFLFFNQTKPQREGKTPPRHAPVSIAGEELNIQTQDSLDIDEKKRRERQRAEDDAFMELLSYNVDKAYGKETND